ncbi:endonuclease [Micromonospora sp. B006]|nr:endonuclease [Micromonospora sp. B006]
MRGLGSLLDSAVPLLGLGVPLLALVALLRRSRPALLAVLLPALVWAGLYGRAWLPPAAGAAGASVRVVSQNLRVGNPDPAASVGALAGDGPDLIGLQEVADGDRVASVLTDRYPHRAVVSTVALWSRWPIREAHGVDTGLGWERALRAVVAAPPGRPDRVRRPPRLRARRAHRHPGPDRRRAGRRRARRPRRAAGGARRPEHRHHRPGLRPADPAAARRAGRGRAGIRLHLAGGAAGDPPGPRPLPGTHPHHGRGAAHPRQRPPGGDRRLPVVSAQCRPFSAGVTVSRCRLGSPLENGQSRSAYATRSAS